MHRLRLYLLILLAIIWFGMLLPYFLVQTSWGAAILSQQLSKLTGYTISIGSVSHSIAQPDVITLEDVIINENKGAEPAANIAKLVIGLDRQQPWQLEHFNYLTVYNGVINDLKTTRSLIRANSVQFIDSMINLHIAGEELTLQNATGGIKPFTASDEAYQFDLTSQTVLFNNLPFKSLLIQGFQRDGILSLTNIGGSFNKGFFVSKLNILADNTLDIDQLQINNLNFQLAVEQDEMGEFFSVFPKMNIHHFSLIDSSFVTNDLSVEKGNIEATNLRYDEGWHLDQGSLIFNAAAMTWSGNLLYSPLIQLKSDNDKITIEKAIATWNQGNVNFTGNWQNDTLQLDQLIIAGANYQLPENFNVPSLPKLFSQITLNNLMVLPSTLIATNPDYSFRFTNFEISGTNITIAQDGKLGLYTGTLFSKAESGTFRGVNIKYPDLNVQILSENSGTFKFSTLLDQGMLESTATIDLAKSDISTFKAEAYNVDSAVLKQWQLVKNPPVTNNFKVDLNGKMSPFGLSGTVFANNNSYAVESQH